MRKIMICLGCLIVAGCGETSKTVYKCSADMDAARCTSDSAISYCRNGEWVEEKCQSSCMYSEAGAVCDKGSAEPVCRVGQSKCTGGGLWAECGSNGQWLYKSCLGGCADGVCNEGGSVPQPQKNRVMRRCSSDKLSIEYLDDKGDVSASRTCKQETGFESTCRDYSNGHVGCAMPDTCTGDFENGKCVNDIYLGCYKDGARPLPFARSCAELDMICLADADLSGCYRECDDTNAAIACTDDGYYVSKCVNAAGKKVVTEAPAFCKNDNVSVICSNKQTVEIFCLPGSKCLNSFGNCVKLCTAEDAGKLECGTDGMLYECQNTDDGYIYVSLGSRECFDDMLNICVTDEESGGYKIKVTDCSTKTSVDASGNTISYRCVNNYLSPGADLCAPIEPDIEGVPCGSVTENGVCIGSKLRYCHADDHILMEGDCRNDKDGFTSCSVISGYADCRKPCTVKGQAKCTVLGGDTPMVSLCFADDNGGNLTFVDGTDVCVDNKLYTCSLNGEVHIENCGAFGGVCENGRCVYPACRADLTAECLPDDAMISCLVDSDGLINGEAVQSMFCDKDGKCRHCEQGRIVE